jgi:transmembrane protein 132
MVNFIRIITGLAGIKDENNDEPTVQARQHNNNINSNNNIGVGSTTVHAHKVPAHVSPFELGMYTLLAALCFAIVAFVISCVVYASKYKQNSLEMPTTTLMSEYIFYISVFCAAIIKCCA